jgi:peptide/nickel transport system substrate-binding protein
MKFKTLRIKFRLRLKKLFLDIRQTHLKDLRNLTFSNIKKIPDIVHLKNLVLFGGILSIVVVAMFVTRFSSLRPLYIKEIPTSGGVYSHGVVGYIEKINPLFAQNEAESVADKLIFSGLTREISVSDYHPDLAESWEISADKLTYIFKLKQGIKWHDGVMFTADDVIFTVGLIQNPDARSPLSQIWRGVVIEKINDYEIKFTLPNAFPGFLGVASQPMLPKHLLSEIDPKSVKVAEFNVNPIGTGPYKFVRFDQIGTQSEIILEANLDFSIHKPFIEQVRVIFFNTEEDLYKGLARRQIMGVSSIPLDKLAEIKRQENLTLEESYLPQYEVLSFNLKNELLAVKEIRKALAMSINREEIISGVFEGNAREVSVPILPGRDGFDSKAKGLTYDVPGANKVLEEAGYLRGEDGVRRKEGKILKFSLVHLDDPENSKIAEIIKNQFARAGVAIELVPTNTAQISANHIRPRGFDILLIGQNVGANEDLYSFWHSSQATDPGLNFSGFSDKKVDKLLELVRKSSDKEYRAERLKQVQEVIIDEQPAIFLFSPLHVSALKEDIRGARQLRISQPNDILNNIYDWYIKTKEIR